MDLLSYIGVAFFGGFGLYFGLSLAMLVIGLLGMPMPFSDVTIVTLDRDDD